MENEAPDRGPRPSKSASEGGHFPKSMLEGVSLFLSTASSLGVVYATISGGDGGGGWLGMATLLTACCLAFVFFTARPAVGTRERGRFVMTASACVAVLGTAWIVVYWDHIRYGTLSAGGYGAPSVLVSENVAWLTLRTPDWRTKTLVAYVDQLAGGGRAARTADLNDRSRERRVLAIDGNADGDSITLSARMIGGTPPQPAGAVESPLMDSRGPSVELSSCRRFMAQPSISESGEVVLTVAKSNLADAVRLAFHTAWGVALAQQGAYTDADKHFEAVLALPSLTKTEALKGAFAAALQTAARYFVDRPSPRMVDARDAIRRALQLLPADGQAIVAEAYLRFADGEEAVQLLNGVQIESDRALVDTLAALMARSKGRFWVAATHYAAAARLEPPKQGQRAAALHVAAAYYFAFSARGVHERTTKITEEANALLRSSPQSVLPYLFKGYARAIEDDALAEESFLQAESFARDPRERALVAYWHAAGDWENVGAHAQSRARKTIERARELLRDARRADPNSAAALALLGEIDRDLSLVKDANEMDRGDPRSSRYLGMRELVLARDEHDRERKSRLQHDALAHLTVAHKNGGDDPEIYVAMGELSQGIAEPEQSRRYLREAHRLRCEEDHEDPSCLVATIEEALDVLQKDPSNINALNQAKVQTRSLLEAFQRRQDAAKLALHEVAVAWYRTGNREIAGRLYAVLEEHYQGDPQPDNRRLVANVVCNHAFVDLDLAAQQGDGSLRLVERAFRSSLRVVESADCYAGLAATLVALGRVDEARNNYRIARGMDGSYANMNTLRQSYDWSPQAIGLLSKLNSEV